VLYSTIVDMIWVSQHPGRRDDTMKTRLLATLTATTLVLLAAACGSKGAPRTSDTGSGTLTLGASLSLTGSLAREGLLTKEGYDVCTKVVNAKGGVPVGGKKLTLTIQYQDDTSKPDTAAQLVDQFNDKGIKLILGPYGSATTEAAAAVIERNGQVMADSSGADDKIFTKGYRHTFAVLSGAKQYAASMIESIADLAKPKPATIAFVSADDGFSKTVTESGRAKAIELGFKVVGVQYVPNGTSDVSQALTRLKSSRPDVIIGSAHLVEGVALIKQAKELGVSPAGGFGETVAPPTPDFVTTLGKSAEGVLGSTQWTITTKGSDQWFGSATDYAHTFAAQFNGRAPEYHGAEATAACLALILAVGKAGGTDPAKVRDTLAALDEQTFFGPLKFSPQGQNIAKPMSVIQIQGGKPVTVWPTDAAEAPLKWPGTAT
jgi:branched-chain amino acid transport system substrate-binding protein